jgi:hypothetical protein
LVVRSPAFLGLLRVFQISSVCLFLMGFERYEFEFLRKRPPFVC